MRPTTTQRCGGLTHQREPNGLSDTPYPLDQVSPIAILKRQLAIPKLNPRNNENRQLLGILRITKQSLSRVLSQLVRQGFIVRRPGPDDRRQRRLDLAPKGQELERQLSEPQRARIANAYRRAGSQAVAGFRDVLLGVIAGEEDRRRFTGAGLANGDVQPLQ